MVTYKILTDINSWNDDLLSSQIKVNKAAFETKYGVKLSPTEIHQSYQHIKTIEQFLECGEPYALIYETLSNIPDIGSIIDDLEKDDWDLVILQGVNTKKYLPQIGYKLGRKWCELNYLISREGANKILGHIREINQIFCDDILTLAEKDDINVFVIQDDDFSFKENILQYDEIRNREILSKIFSMNRWDDENKIRIRELLKVVFEKSRSLGVDMFLNEGTLLGCIRHGEIMRWDDDVDLAIDVSDVNVLLDALKENSNLEVGTSYWKGKYPYYKVWLKDGDEIKGYTYKFPFIDIWTFEIIDSLFIKYNFGATYPVDDILPLSDCRFENTLVKVPKNPLSYLNKKYPKWQEKIVFYPYCHQKERADGKVLEAYIVVDGKGKMKSY